MRRLNRPVRFSDLARRWAADPRYASSIALIAESFQHTFCQRPMHERAAGGGTQSSLHPPAPSPAAKARGRLIARTIWQRGEGSAGIDAAVPPLPQPVQRSSQRGDAASGGAVAAGKMLSGLQSMARLMNQNVMQWPAAFDTQPAIIAPPPRLADRVPRLAAR